MRGPPLAFDRSSSTMRMPLTALPRTMTSPGSGETAPTGLAWSWRAMLMVDVVDSGRIFKVYRDAAIDRWFRYVDQIRDELVPAAAGRFIKSTGDGFLLAFDDAPTAAAAALDIQRRLGPINAGVCGRRSDPAARGHLGR